jgi:hypothetical protein
MVKNVIIIIFYTLNKFHYSYENIIVDHGNNNNIFIKKQLIFNKKNRFINVESDPRLASN